MSTALDAGRKAALRRDGHIRERSPGSFELRYSLGTDPASGKRRMATATVRGTKADAQRELRRLLRALDTGEHVGPHRMTVAAWLRSWLAAVRPEVSPKTVERYGEVVEHYLIPALGSLHLVKLAPADIQAAYAGWAAGGRRDGRTGALAPRTRQHHHRILSAALGRALEQQLIARNPCDVFKKRLPKVERRDMTTLTAVQAVALLDAVRHSHIYPAVLLALHTGMRRGEILALRWRNVDFDRAVLRVVESLEQTKTALRFKEPKTGKARAITLAAGAVDELRRLKREQAEALLMLGVRQDGDTLVCARRDGEPLQPQSLTHEFPRFLGRVTGLPRIRFHDLRHTHATLLLAAGEHPKVAQERLGHSTIVTTLDLYSHVTQTMQEQAAARLDDAFRHAGRPGA